MAKAQGEKGSQVALNLLPTAHPQHAERFAHLLIWAQLEMIIWKSQASESVTCSKSKFQILFPSICSEKKKIYIYFIFVLHQISVSLRMNATRL